jgi:hypothetical protein
MDERLRDPARRREDALNARWRGDVGYPQTRGGTTRALLLELLHVELIGEGEGVRARLTGWGRDLTAHVADPSVPDEALLPALLDRIDDAVRAVVPAEYLQRLASATPRRDVGDTLDVPRLDEARLRELMAAAWPSIEITSDDGGFRADPYGSTPVLLGITREQSTLLAAAVLVDGFPVTRLLRVALPLAATERGVRVALGMMDEWLRISRPSRDVLALPITEEDPRG